MKYIMFDKFFPVIFPDAISHAEVAQGINKKPTSAGFIVDGECTGFSDTLNMGSQKGDTSKVKVLLRLSDLKFDGENYNPVEKTK